MPRLTLVLILALGLVVLAATPAAASPASAADRCRPRSGEQVLARSAQAVVLQKVVRQSQHFPLQTISGCSRRSGKRRTLETLQRRTEADSTRFIGVKLAGTRVAYVMVRDVSEPQLALMADDAVHGGRRHDLGVGGWPFVQRAGYGTQTGMAWAVDAQGDVAWITTDRGSGLIPAPQTLGVWRAGLGRRQVDSHALLGGVTLRDGVLRWQRDGTPRQVDLAAVPPTRCGALKATIGTLDVDIVHDHLGDTSTACLRATGRTVSRYMEDFDVVDANGPYLLLRWYGKVLSFTTVFDLVRGTSEDIEGAHADTVVDEHGSLAWIADGLWVRDAAGPRKVAGFADDPAANASPLLRDGSTVTWPGVGARVTLSP
jgi:hypothetical protein